MTHGVSAALARKLTVGQQEQGDKPRSVLRALRLAFARSAGDRLQLPLVVIGARQSYRTSDTLMGQIGEDWLLLQFVNKEGMTAAICLDIGAVSAIVQVQTFGQVSADNPAPRAFTDTDGAMVAPLVEDAMGRAAASVDVPGDCSGLSGYEFASRFANLRILSLALADEAYRVFDLTVELGGGLRQGQISVLLPDRPAEDENELAQEDMGPNLEHASGVLRADLNTVICRMSLPLSALSRLQVGDLLPLAGSRLDQAEVLTIDRTRAAIGRLGQSGGMRAVRLNEYTSVTALSQPDLADFVDALAASTEAEPTTKPTVDMAQLPAMIDTDTNLNFEDSDQMVAEISQLAGLTITDSNPDDSV